MQIAALSCALACSVASAQVSSLIEIRVVGEGEGVNGYGRVDATFLFDTRKAFEEGVVKALDATAAFSMDQTPGPFDLSGGVYKQDQGAVATLGLSPDSDGYALIMIGRDPDPHISLKLEISSAPGFAGATLSLPERPEDYFVAPGGNVLLQYAEEQGSIASIGWGESVGYFGGKFSIAVREVEPAPADLCDADLAAPFGELNFNDVLAYLTSFGAGCP